MTEAALFAFFCVFIRCSALMLSSPVFGAQTTPVNVRVMTTLALSGAITAVVQPKAGPVPADLGELLVRLGGEVLIGLLIGSFMTMALQTASIGGALMDVQTGLSSGQVMNPINGVSSTIISQFKFMLSVVVFLSMDGHHLLIQAMIGTYDVAPNINAIQTGLTGMLTAMFGLALQIALPTLGVGMLVDAALGLINRAVPSMQALQVGMPAKIAIGLTAVSIGLPAVAGATHAATHAAFKALGPVLGG
ncbi:MAG: flagellar biosynthetic protein FliR [Fimbriimonas sp.]